MVPSMMRSRRVRLTAAWVALFSFFNASTLVAEDDCERLNSAGETRDCTYLEEMHECLDDANESLDDCLADAGSQDSFVEKAIGAIGCEAAFEVNMIACGLGVTGSWAVNKF